MFFSIPVALVVSLEQPRYIVNESASEFEVCVFIANGPDIVPQMEMDVTVFASNSSDGGTYTI